MRRWTLTLLALLLPLLASAQQGAPDTAERFAKLLQKLGADEFQEREAASAELATLPADALKLIEAELARKDLDPELSTRLNRARAQIKANGKKAVVEQKRQTGIAWNQRTTVDDYDKVGRKDPKWDKPVKEALPMLARFWQGDKQQARRAYELCNQAVLAGCDDPLVLYGRARIFDVVIRSSWAQAVQMHVDAAKAMSDHGEGYHPMRQCFAYARAADCVSRVRKDLSKEEKKQAREWLDLALGVIEKGASDPDVPDALIREVGEVMTDAAKKLTGDRKDVLEMIFQSLTKARPDSTIALVLKGDVYVSYAWDARGSGYANTVTDDGWKKMRERLATAEECLTQAWKKDPDNPEPPTLMIGVELGQGKGRPVMELWYKRAMQADPDHLEACKKKMYYLEPKWYGSEEAMLEFGRELLAGGNWEVRMPFQLVDAHLKLAGYTDKEKGGEYWKKEGVWEDVKAVYDGYLKRHPESTWDRSFYTKLMCYCGRWKEAKAMFDELGDKISTGAFKEAGELARLKAEAESKGK